MTTINDIEPTPCDKAEIHYPHGYVDMKGAHACPGIANEDEQQKMLERLKELRAKADEIQAAQSQATDTDAAAFDDEFSQRLSEEFDRMCQERHLMGAKKYGPVKFLRVDSLEEAAEEVVDLANYARYTFIKLRLLQAQAAEFEELLKALQSARNDLVVPDVQSGPPTFVNPFRKD